MAYEKTVWVNGQAPALDAEHLNKIEQGIADAVSITPQSLTDAQKAQARGNINAAPGGFGLGQKNAKQISSWDDAVENGWYYGPAPAGIGAGDLWGRVDSLSNGYAVQTIYSDTFVATAKRFLIGTAWKSWEWVNPPMELGTEYRTTERYLGKPVYVKTINMGNLPGNAVKQASFQSNNVVDKIVSVTGQCTSDSGVNMSLPYHAGSGPNWNTVILIGATGVGTAQIVTFAEDFAGYTDACITVKYTKLAD